MFFRVSLALLALSVVAGAEPLAYVTVSGMA